MNKKFNLYLFFGLITIFVTLAHFSVFMIKGWFSLEDIWWSSKPIYLTNKSISDDFKIFLENRELESLIEEGKIIYKTTDQYKTLQIKDLKIRKNNIKDMKIFNLKFASVIGVFFGASLTIFIIGIVKYIQTTRVQKKS